MTIQEKEQKKYNDYVSQVTPTHNIWRNMFRAFICGGGVCVIGQLICNVLTAAGIEKEAAGTWTSVILVLIAVILTMFHIFGVLTKYAGAGLLVPITGFANSVASPAIEYAPEGEVFGKGVQIFSIAGPVVLYGVLSSWGLGVIYLLLKVFGIFN